MIAVIQCAGSKRSDAGFMRTREGLPVVFVAHPELASPTRGVAYAAPDQSCGAGMTWRSAIDAYNEDFRKRGINPFRLLAACDLYQNHIYRDLADHFGRTKTYILSAGWGLIAADTLIPNYDITFNSQAEPMARRYRTDWFNDACMLADSSESIVFFGSQHYVPLFAGLTRGNRSDKMVFYNAKLPPEAPGCTLVRFKTTMRTNWQYQCAANFMAAHPQRPDDRT